MGDLLPRDGKGQNRYELGYTLPVPLLKLFKPSGADWVINDEAVGRLVRTLRDTDRPSIVYLFSTHFGQDAPIEKALSADPANLSVTPNGPLPNDTYHFGSDIFNWSFAKTGTPLTARRVQAVQAVLNEICKLEPRHIEKIRGVTLLGELHHLFPNFQGGMGFTGPYLVSDYSDASKQGFRAFLQRNYGQIERLNQALGTSWTSFEEVAPPSKDVRTTPLRDFTEHIDSFAHGFLPIAGWAHVKGLGGNSPAWIRIYRNGELIGRTPVDLGRQDVLEALPGLGDANTGWRFDMPFKDLPTGLHRIDVFLEDGSATPMHLATRHVAIMGRTQQTPQPLPQKALPASRPLSETTKAHLDLPADQSSYFYNPLVPLWHAFRGQQVVDYLEFFAERVGQSCLSQTKRYTHQIIPFTNPGWDANKFAIDASLQKLKDIRLGASLYGEPTYGTSFAQWLRATGHKAYGVTEFHPLKAMQASEFQTALDAHANRGAEFISFFLEPRWEGKLVDRGHNIFSLDPANAKFGSAQLYESAREALKRQR
ncbi:MAG TPA: beta-galactosidase [Burkholderiaceae bacterium]|nr:beta-galactosidase [Burkholderiaceae bacterium]